MSVKSDGHKVWQGIISSKFYSSTDGVRFSIFHAKEVMTCPICSGQWADAAVSHRLMHMQQRLPAALYSSRSIAHLYLLK